jgi:hypothetical protein
MPLRVTFDTNALNDLLSVSPETSQRGAVGHMHGTKVRSAIEAGYVEGFFSETLVTIEGIQKKDRVDVLGSTQLQSRTTSADKNTITISIGVVQDRKPLDPQFSDKIQAARNLGLRALMVPRLLAGGVCAKDEDGTLFEPLEDLEQFVAKAVCLRSEIGARDIGHSAAVSLGLTFNARDGVFGQELWFQGLSRARTKGERKQVARAAAEWADGDSVAAHYGYGIDLFCSEDFGQNTSGASVLDDNNRKWLNEGFGIHFVTLAKLADMVTA